MKKVLINVEERELRVAILEDDQLVELYSESLDDKTILNNIYKGRIEGVIPGLKAAFVNIGMERNAFLHFDDVRADLLLSKKGAVSAEAVPAAPEQIAPDAAVAPVEPVVEYTPSPEELAVVEALETPVSPVDEAAEGVPQGFQQQAPFQQGEGGRRRRRRGRRGGRRRGRGEGLEPGESEIPTERPPQADAQPVVQQPRPQAPPSPGNQQSHARREHRHDRHRDPNRRHDRHERFDRQPRRPPQQPPPQPGNQWVPPPAGSGAFGTRATANPYDVFSPYSQPPAPKRRKKERVPRGGTGRGHGFHQPGTHNTGKDSQEDFFPPVRRHDVPFGPVDDVHPPQFPQPVEHYPDEDEFEGPAPGNEKFPTERPVDHGRKGRRPPRGRVMKRRGPAQFASRAPKAKDNEEKGAPAEKKPRSRKKAAEETDSPPAAAKPKTARRKGDASPAEDKPKRTVRKPAQTEEIAPAEAVAAEKPQRTRTKKTADVPPPGPAEAAAPAEQQPKGRRGKATTSPAPETTAQPVPPSVEPGAPKVTPTDVKEQRPSRDRGRGRGRRGKPAPTVPQAPDSAAPEQASAESASQPEGTPQQSEEQQAGAGIMVPGQAPRQDRPRFDRHRDRHKKGFRRPEEQREFRPRPKLPSVPEVFKKGDELMVQVIKEEIGLKGARISTYISLPGRYLVLLPYPNEEGGVSRKVEDFHERKRLKKILREISSEDLAFIVRTAGVDRDENEIRSDVEFLSEEWKQIAGQYEKSTPTQLVYDDHNILYRLARDVFDENITEILIDSKEQSEELKGILQKLIPSLVDKVKLYEEPENIFHRFQVQKQIQKAARRKVWLKSGGYLIIDEAEALTAIDVNTGKFIGKDDQEKMILKTNLEASKAIARELKLRDIGGLIVVDFIDMKDQRNRDQVLHEFRGYLKNDRSKTSVSGISEFGLVEMTRKRVKQSLRKTLFMDCPYCQGAGVVLNEQQIWLHIKHEMVRMLEGATPPPSLSIVTNPKIRAYIDQNYRDAIQRLEQKYGVEIHLSMSDVYHVENYAIEKYIKSGVAIAG